MTSDRKKPGVTFWATVVVVVGLIGYPLSFGPACWLVDRWDATVRPVSFMYWPILWTMRQSQIARKGFRSVARPCTTHPEMTILRLMTSAGLISNHPGVDYLPF